MEQKLHLPLEDLLRIYLTTITQNINFHMASSSMERTDKKDLQRQNINVYGWMIQRKETTMLQRNNQSKI